MDYLASMLSYNNVFRVIRSIALGIFTLNSFYGLNEIGVLTSKIPSKITLLS